MGVFLGPFQPPETQILGQIFGDTHTDIDVDLCLIETVALINVLDSFQSSQSLPVISGIVAIFCTQ